MVLIDAYHKGLLALHALDEYLEAYPGGGVLGIPIEAHVVEDQLIGKRQSTFSCVYLHDIVSVEMETREQRRAKKPQNGIRRYIYLPTIFAPSSCRITVKSRYEHAEIVIEVTEEFASLLREYVSIAVAARAAEDED